MCLSDCADVQTDLCLCCSQTPEDRFSHITMAATRTIYGKHPLKILPSKLEGIVPRYVPFHWDIIPRKFVQMMTLGWP